MAEPEGLGDGYTESSSGKITLFFFIVLFFHLLDVFTVYQSTGLLDIGLRISYYIVVVICAAWLLPGEGSFFVRLFSKQTGTFLIVSAIAVMLPIIISLLGSKIVSVLNDNIWFSFFLIFCPPWVVYLLFTHGDESNFLRVVRKLWTIPIVLLLLATLVTSVSDLSLSNPVSDSYINVNPGDMFRELYQKVTDAGSNLFDGLSNAGSNAVLFINTQLNDSIGYNFQGQVDPYTTTDYGVQFEKIYTSSSKYYEGADVTVHAHIQGDTFGDQISLVLRCFAVSKSGSTQSVIEGEITTQTRYGSNVVIKNKQPVSATCTLENLTEGYYTVHFAGSFNFATEAYIPYYFVPYDLLESAWAQDIDPAEDAGIAKNPVAIYTGGPVRLGLASEFDQPIGIDLIKDKNKEAHPDTTLPIYGASLSNNWLDGEISSTRKIQLIVPEPFILKNCDRKDVNGNDGYTKELSYTTNKSLPSYRIYTFGNLNDANANAFFESVSCYLGFDSVASAENLISGYDMVQRTFAARTEYLYTIEDEIQLQVYSKGATS